MHDIMARRFEVKYLALHLVLETTDIGVVNSITISGRGRSYRVALPAAPPDDDTNPYWDNAYEHYHKHSMLYNDNDVYWMWAIDEQALSPLLVEHEPNGDQSGGDWVLFDALNWVILAFIHDSLEPMTCIRITDDGMAAGDFIIDWGEPDEDTVLHARDVIRLLKRHSMKPAAGGAGAVSSAGTE